MKKYFIIDLNEEGHAMGFATNNLEKDFIHRYKITWDESSSKNIFEPPVIENLEVGVGNRVIYIFDMTEGPMRPDADIKSCIGSFNLFTEDYYDDIIDFLYEHWRDIEESNESKSIKKFEDFK